MAFSFNFAPPRVDVPQRDVSFMDTIMQRRDDRKAGDAVQQFAGGLPPEDAARYAPLLQNPQTRDMALKEIMARGRPAEQPSGVREYEYAKSQGYPGSFADWELSKRKAGANSTNVTVGEGSKFYEELDKQNAQGFSTLYNEGMGAGRTLQDIDRLEGLLKNTPQGAVGALKSFAGDWGINTDKLDDIQAASALINRLVPAQRPAGSGQMSDRDIELFKASLPRIINQPGGNQKIIETLRGINQYVQMQGDVAARVANRQISPEQGRAELMALRNPLEGFTPPPNAPQAGQGQPVRINSPEEFQALPSGAQFIAPDGSVRTKP